MYKIAHISDLHISRISFKISQIFSKRWLGNFNLLIKRKKFFEEKIFLDLLEILKEEKIDLIIVSGDISSTSYQKEFETAKALFNSLKIKTLFLPGNHDNYTKKAYKNKLFYRYFENMENNKIFSLKKDKVEGIKLNDKWWYVALDTTCATNLLSSRGHFSKKIDKNLNLLLQKINKDKNIILANHFPFIETSFRKNLKGRDLLQETIKKHKNIKIFLHGHIHKKNIFMFKNMPITFSIGPACHIKEASCNILELENNKCNFKRFLWDQKWEKELFIKQTFHF